jgi:hypothetical protein
MDNLIVNAVQTENGIVHANGHARARVYGWVGHLPRESSAPPFQFVV